MMRYVPFCFSFFLWYCGTREKPDETVQFTRVDTLTERFLAYQDSIVGTWNIMINDDNQKIKAMHNLLHELSISHPEERERLKEYEERVNQLVRMRYTQKSMANADVIEEYDFASNSLVSELISLAEAQREFAYNTTLQKLVDQIREAEQRVYTYRAEYDSIVMLYNRFVERNERFLREIDLTSKPEKKPLFQMVSD
jgi:hypothetical protein